MKAICAALLLVAGCGSVDVWYADPRSTEYEYSDLVDAADEWCVRGGRCLEVRAGMPPNGAALRLIGLFTQAEFDRQDPVVRRGLQSHCGVTWASGMAVWLVVDGQYPLRPIALHEFGHLLGVDHRGGPDDIMWAGDGMTAWRGDHLTASDLVD